MNNEKKNSACLVFTQINNQVCQQQRCFESVCICVFQDPMIVSLVFDFVHLIEQFIHPSIRIIIQIFSKLWTQYFQPSIFHCSFILCMCVYILFLIINPSSLVKRTFFHHHQIRDQIELD